MTDTSKQKNITYTDKNSVKEVTRRILRMDGNTLKLSLASLVSLVLFVSPIVLSSALAYMGVLSGLVGLPALVILVGGMVFVALPCLAAYQRLAKRLVGGEDVSLLDVVASYRSERNHSYFKDMLLSLLYLLCAFVVSLVFVGAFVQIREAVIMSVIIEPFEMMAFVAFWLCCAVGALLVPAYALSYLFFVPYLYIGGAKLKDAVRMSVSRSSLCRAQIIKQEFLYLFYLLLGLLSLGVLLVIRCAPMTAVSYFVFGNRVFDDTSCEK